VSILHKIRQQIVNIGYRAIERNYAFSDVFSAANVNRVAPIAAFTSTPTSYRNAALAVVEANESTSGELTSEFRALGAPLLFVVSGDSVVVWKVAFGGAAQRVAEATSEELEALFSKHAEVWGPASIHRAKSIGQFRSPAQLDFIDIGLLPAIEGEVHAKLDILLNQTLAEAVGLKGGRAKHGIEEQLLFRTIFRLLAAKVLQDREHDLSKTWDAADIKSVLDVISKHYTLVPLPGEQSTLQSVVFASAWERLRRGINFRNISADDLAFVYENTLITTETRRDFGTHGTPRSVAEYIVTQLRLSDFDPNGLRVYEPFVGAGIFLVAALRTLRESLPIEWDDAQRHRFLVERITGDEVDPFAKEVATMSLILADYPSANGWKITTTDLFQNNHLSERLEGASVILCNPPFQDFTPEERLRYPLIAKRSISKPIAVLDTVLEASPDAVGFVLPEPFIRGIKYQGQRKEIEKKYRNIEVVELPDRIFKHAVIRTSLLIARDLRSSRQKSAGIFLRSTDVTVRDREEFLRSGKISATRTLNRTSLDSVGELWIGKLPELWEWLRGYRSLDDFASVHRGIEWPSGLQSSAVSLSPKKGYVPGISDASAVKAFAIVNPAYLDARPENLRRRAADGAWSENKIVANAARLSRGPWCFAAAVDRSELITSQQLYGIWPKSGTSLEVLAAVLNGPVANAFIAIHSPADRIRRGTLLSVPVPEHVPSKVNELAKQYSRVVHQGADLFSERLSERADMLLQEIDALVLKAYDLPPRLEKELLELFRDTKRPTLHEWKHWLPADFAPFIPLHEFLSDQYSVATGPWIQEVFEPLPPDEANALREYMD
jgi:type I restriction-modification system DNA methylase subunit